MENRETPVKYLDFILQKSIDDLRKDSKSRLDFDAVNMYFNYVKKAKDTLKAVYTLMHIAKMKETAVYLLFVLKKIKEGAVNFDTLDENAREDCDFIKGELIKNFSLSVEPGDEPELKIPEVSGSGLSEMVKENKFKVRSDEDASIAEEFSEKEFYRKEEDVTPEDVPKEEPEVEIVTENNDEEIQEGSEEEEAEESKEVIKMTFGDEEFELISNSEEGEEVFEIYDGSPVEKEDEIVEEDTGGDLDSIEIADDEVDNTEEIPEYLGEIEGEGFVIKKTITTDAIDSTERSVESGDTQEAIDDEDLDDGYIESEVITEEVEEVMLLEEREEREEKAEDTEEEITEIETANEEITEEEAAQDEKTDPEAEEPEPEEQEKEVSEQYKDYEKTLFEVNELLKDYFLDIESVPEGAASPDGEPVIFGKISELCNIMRNRSDKMSFSIISNIYMNTGAIFKEYLKTNSRPNADELVKLNKGISLVEALIKGDDTPEADDEIASLEALRKSFSDVVDESASDVTDADESSKEVIAGEEAGEDKPEEKESEVTEEYKQSVRKSVSLKEKYSNAELRESFKQLKTQIQDLENTFQSLDEIEGDYQNYEGLRTLSSTFLNLKEIIRRAKILDLKNVAKLSEAGYVFIKFIQNYRMNPFDEDIREIFKYIIYNFKAAALDKPNEDLERFISYLNDPVKIFTQKNNKRN